MDRLFGHRNSAGTGIVSGPRDVCEWNCSSELINPDFRRQRAVCVRNHGFKWPLSITQVVAGRPFTLRAFDPRGLWHVRTLNNNVVPADGAHANGKCGNTSAATVHVIVQQATNVPLAMPKSISCLPGRILPLWRRYRCKWGCEHSTTCLKATSRLRLSHRIPSGSPAAQWAWFTPADDGGSVNITINAPSTGMSVVRCLALMDRH